LNTAICHPPLFNLTRETQKEKMKKDRRMKQDRMKQDRKERWDGIG